VTYMVLVGDLVPVGTTLVTPGPDVLISGTYCNCLM